jgi:hypothetical protein
MVAADGLPGMRVSCSWGSGNDSLDVMLDSVREALAVDNRERKGASALSISYRVTYKMTKVYLALLRGYLVVDKGELDKFVVGFGYSALQAGLSVRCECPCVRCVARAGAFNKLIAQYHDTIKIDNHHPSTTLKLSNHQHPTNPVINLQDHPIPWPCNLPGMVEPVVPHLYD